MSANTNTLYATQYPKDCGREILLPKEVLATLINRPSKCKSQTLASKPSLVRTQPGTYLKEDDK